MGVITNPQTGIAPGVKVPKLPLADVVQQKIDEKVSSDESFSAWNITQEVREAVNKHEVTIDGLRIVPLGQNPNTQYIAHDEVRALVYPYADALSGYRRRDTGQYQLWEPHDGDDDDDVDLDSDGPLDVSSQYSQQSTATTPPTAAQLNQIPHRNRLIKTYIDNRLAVNDPPTLKSVQSRMKGWPLSLDDIKDIAVAEGFTVTPSADGDFHRDSVITS